MTWTLKWGAHVKAFEAHAKKTGVAAGPLANRPKLLGKDLAYFNAFSLLSEQRDYSDMDRPQAIKVSEILAFCTLVGIASQMERVKYLSLIKALDQIWTKHAADTQKNKKKP